MTIAIFTAGTPSAERLVKAAIAQGHTVISGLFDTDETRASLIAADICIIRFSTATYQRACDTALLYRTQNPDGILSISEWGIRTSSDKYLAYHHMQKAGIRTPQTYLVERLEDIQTHSLASRLPLIVKPRIENKGTGVMLANTLQELESAISQLLIRYGSCIAQDFVAESAGKDIRAFVIGDRVIAAMERTAANGSVTANLSTGGTAQPIELDAASQLLAVTATKTFNATYAGVDLLIANDGMTVLEVNPSAGFGLSDVAHIDLPAAIITYLAEEYTPHD